MKEEKKKDRITGKKMNNAEKIVIIIQKEH